MAENGFDVTDGADKDPKAVGAMFSSIAPVYDVLNHTLSLGWDIRWKRKLVRGADLPSDGVVLDLCTGTGDVALEFLTGRPDFKGRVYGIDFSALMIDIARGKVARLHPPLPRRIDFLVGDAIDLHFPDEKFDVVTVAFGVRNYADTKRGLEEMHRVLKPGGQASVLEFFPGGGTPEIVRWYTHRILPVIGNVVSHSKAYNYLLDTSDSFHTPDQFCKLLSESGFSDIIRERMTFGIAHIVRARKG